MTVRIPDKIAKEAEKLAKDRSMSVSSLYTEVIEAHVKEERRKRAFERINRLIGNTCVTSDFREQLAEMRKESDRDLK